MKCSKHPEKDAVAICEGCSLLYCGDCALSSNGKCPKCGNTLRSPQSVMSYEISQKELYKGRGQPNLIEAINSLYIEPERGMRRLNEYPSLFVGIMNITILYLTIIFLRIVALLLIALVLMPETSGAAISSLVDAQFLFAFFIGAILEYGLCIFAWMFISFVCFIPAKLLGGKGTFAMEASLLSHIMVALLPLFLVSIVLVFIPTFGFFIAVAAVLITSFYLIFLVFLSIRETNEFDTVRAIASLLISIGIFGFLSIMLLLIYLLILAIPLIGNLVHPSF